MHALAPEPTILGISLASWLTMLAIVGGPISALMVQRWIDRVRARKDRKLKIFRDLMANRAARLSPQFVQALNAIEVEFYENNEVIQAWREYLAHITTPFPAEKGDAEQREWNDKIIDHLNKLLYQMAGVLGYHFDPLTLKRSVYYPSGWWQVESEQLLLRKASIDVLSGNRPLKMEICRPVAIVGEPSSPVQPPAADIEVSPEPTKPRMLPDTEEKL